MSRQLSLPLRAQRGWEEVASNLGLDFRIDGRTAVRVRLAPRGWECANLLASHACVVPNEYEALAMARRVVRMLVA
jgi:hypothetical protein